MPQIVILDSTANLVASFDSEEEVRRALEAIVQQDPGSADEYAMIPYGPDGLPCGDAVVGSDIGVPASAARTIQALLLAVKWRIVDGDVGEVARVLRVVAYGFA